MLTLARTDVLRALKHFLCLVKQDVLISDHLDDPGYWKAYATAREGVYRWLERIVSKCGVEQAYLLAVQRYESLPLFVGQIEQQGEREALEVFFLSVTGGSPGEGKDDSNGTWKEAKAF